MYVNSPTTVEITACSLVPSSSLSSVFFIVVVVGWIRDLGGGHGFLLVARPLDRR